MVEWVQFTLRAWDRRGQKLGPAEFVDRLCITSDDPVAVSESRPGVREVQLLNLSREDFAIVDASADAGAQSEAFAAAIRDGLTKLLLGLSVSRQPYLTSCAPQESRRPSRLPETSAS
jgi:hypothetical protein